MACCGSTLVAVHKDFVRLGLAEKGIGRFDFYPGMNETIAGIVGEAAEGCYTLKFTASSSGEPDQPGMQNIFQSAREYRKYTPEKVTWLYASGWCHARIVAETVRLAIEQVGFENLTRQAVRDAIVSMKDFDTGGLTGPVTISEEHPYWADKVKIYEMRGGKMRPITGWMPYSNPGFIRY